MSLKRVVDTRFWNQVDVMERYSSQDKLFALYLMTCPRSTQLGIYSLPKRVIAFDMSLDHIESNVPFRQGIDAQLRGPRTGHEI